MKALHKSCPNSRSRLQIEIPQTLRVRLLAHFEDPKHPGSIRRKAFGHVICSLLEQWLDAAETKARLK